MVLWTVLAVLALSIASIAYRRHDSQALPVREAAPTQAGADVAPAPAPPAIVLDEADNGGFASAPSAAPEAPDPRLFEHDAPLAHRIAQLDERARRGDPAAGCQLGFELIRCDRARQLVDHFQNVERQVTGWGTRTPQGEELDARIDAALRRRERHRAVMAACEGVDLRDWAEPARYLHAAAQAGHRPAIRESLAQGRYMPDSLFRDPGLIPLFRANAPRYFEALLHAGDSRLLERWAVADIGTGDILLDALPPPWNRPELARAVMRQRIEQAAPPGDSARPDTDPPELRAEAQQLYAQHFAPHEAEDRAARERMAGHEYGDLSAYECETLAAPQSARR